MENPNYDKELSAIENRINQYEQTSLYMQDAEKHLQQIRVYGFEKEIMEIRNSYIIDKDKQKDMRKMLLIPKKIHQAKKWIRDIQKNIDNRDRICFLKLKILLQITL